MTRPPPNNPVFSSLAENLRIARSYRRWSQEQLAEECGLNRNYVAKVEAAALNLTVENLERIAAGLGVSGYVLLMPIEDAQKLLFAASRELDKKPVGKRERR
jgi:transcriptional regulator with XRE-family HTH domain